MFCSCLTPNRSTIPSRKSYVLLGSLQRLAGWLLLIFFIFFTQSIKFGTFHYHALRVQMFKNVNGVLFSAGFVGKVGLVFVLTLENIFSERFDFKANRKSICSSKKRYY